MSRLEEFSKKFWEMSRPTLAPKAHLTEVERELYEERAAIMEYDAGMPRKEAEMAAMQYILGDRRQSP